MRSRRRLIKKSGNTNNRYLFELSKEYLYLPRDEILSTLRAENIEYNIVDEKPDILAIETSYGGEISSKLASRIALSFSINNFLFSCKPSELEVYAEKHHIYDRGSIAITYRNRSQNISSRDIISRLAKVYTRDRNVSLEKPDVEIHIVITDERIFVGRKLSVIDRSGFEKRKAQYRPFFSPISLHPRLARALVNLSQVPSNGKLLDPFCGTGGILIEAGLIGIDIYGGDIEDKMIKGCRENLEYYNIGDYHLYNVDVGEITSCIDEKMDAVVTDLPYGKAATMKGEKMEKLYSRAFQSISDILKDNGRAVIGISNRDMIYLGRDYLSLLKVYKIRVHRSLNRFFAVYSKP